MDTVGWLLALISGVCLGAAGVVIAGRIKRPHRTWLYAIYVLVVIGLATSWRSVANDVGDMWPTMTMTAIVGLVMGQVASWSSIERRANSSRSRE